jgi:sulfonate transport system permease protein
MSSDDLVPSVPSRTAACRGRLSLDEQLRVADRPLVVASSSRSLVDVGAGARRGPRTPRGSGARVAGTSLWLGVAVPLGLVLVWFATTSWLGVFSPHQLPSPGQVAATAGELARGGELARHVGASAVRIALGFAAGASAALVLGTVVGLSRTVEALIDPTLQLVRNVPSLAWVPFLLLWLGIDEAPKITLIAIGGFFPVYLNLVTGIRQTDRKLIEVGHVFGMRRAELVRRVVLPSALPYLLVGLRVGLGQSWLFLVAAELIASTRGLGYLLIDGQNTARPDMMLVGLLVLAGLGKLSDTLVRRVERRALHWTDAFAGGAGRAP